MTTMKFYFCEKCGARLTENDVAEGHARDKKLKGVYCEACSIGVLTLETLPLTDSDAHKILNQEPKATKTPAKERLRRRGTDAQKLPPRSRSISSDHARGNAVKRNRQRISPAAQMAMGAMAIVVLVAGLAVILSGTRGIWAAAVGLSAAPRCRRRSRCC